MSEARIDMVDPFFTQQWPLHLLNIPQCWKITKGNGAKVGLVDSGVDYSHEDLGWRYVDLSAADHPDVMKRKLMEAKRAVDNGSHPKIMPGYNLIDGDTETFDNQSHGTYIAGVIAADYLDGFGMVGVAPECRIKPIVVVNKRGYANIETLGRGIKSCYDCDVISLSLAYHYTNTTVTSIIEDAIEQGIIVVAATGNNNKSVVCFPASIHGVIAVGGCNPKMERWVVRSDFGSNYGGEIDCIAPASEQVVTWSLRSRFKKAIGSSLSVGYISGIAALCKSIDRSVTSWDLMSLIAKHSTGGGKWNVECGHGVPDAYGIVNEVASQKPERDVATELRNIGVHITEIAALVEAQSRPGRIMHEA